MSTATIIRLQPKIATQPCSDGRAKLLREAFRAGRSAGLFEPKNANPYNADDDLRAEWDRGYADGTSREEKRRAAFSAGKQAAMFNPTAGCPYAEFMACEMDLHASWTAGFEHGMVVTQNMPVEEKAWAQGWHAGLYRLSVSCPYLELELRKNWELGLAQGKQSGEMILTEFGRVMR